MASSSSSSSVGPPGSASHGVLERFCHWHALALKPSDDRDRPPWLADLVADVRTQYARLARYERSVPRTRDERETWREYRESSTRFRHRYGLGVAIDLMRGDFDAADDWDVAAVAAMVATLSRAAPPLPTAPKRTSDVFAELLEQCAKRARTAH